jgi:hypothetical protein
MCTIIYTHYIIPVMCHFQICAHMHIHLHMYYRICEPYYIIVIQSIQQYICRIYLAATVRIIRTHTDVHMLHVYESRQSSGEGAKQVITYHTLCTCAVGLL